MKKNKNSWYCDPKECVWHYVFEAELDELNKEKEAKKWLILN